MILYYIHGSPFARMGRVLLREYGIPHTEKEIVEFPPAPEYFEVNPLGQVPVLDDGSNRYFPTRIVLARIMTEAQTRDHLSNTPLARELFRPDHHWHDEQLLMVLLGMGDTLAAAKYMEWAGMAVVNSNRLGFNPIERNMDRVYRTLDWLEARSSESGFWPSLSVQDVVLACLILWSEVRGGIRWRGRPNLEGAVDRLKSRPSFLETAPRLHHLFSE